jgi:hypothetical protein
MPISSDVVLVTLLLPRGHVLEMSSDSSSVLSFTRFTIVFHCVLHDHMSLPILFLNCLHHDYNRVSLIRDLFLLNFAVFFFSKPLMKLTAFENLFKRWLVEGIKRYDTRW